MKTFILSFYPVVLIFGHRGHCWTKVTESGFKSKYNQHIGFFSLSACTHTSQDRQKHTMNLNNLRTIGRITVHSTFVKLFGIRDHFWENNSKTVEKIAFCLLGTTTLYFLLLLFFFKSPCIHRFHTDTFTRLHDYLVETAYK